MNLEERNIEDIDLEDYEMVPIEPMMYGCDQMNMMPSVGMNPCMGMSQFNEGTFRDGFNPNGMMFGDPSRNDYDLENEDFRQMDKYEDNEDTNNPYLKYNDIDSSVRRIEQYNPAIFRRLTRCGMPYVEAKEIVRSTVKLALMYRDE
ncbi:MAG TPA: hypothetical protein VIM70_22655 [Clostridium sp.]|uniref:hypothetical protein n=1 Tax=Clostridium sp. TaxID=1506 RepID=UPI002F952B95